MWSVIMRQAVLTYYTRQRTMLLYTQGRALLLPTDQSRESGRILRSQEKSGWRFDARWVSRSIFKWNLKTINLHFVIRVRNRRNLAHSCAGFRTVIRVRCCAEKMRAVS